MQRKALYLSYLLMLAATFVVLLGLGARLDFWQVPWMFGLGTRAPFAGVAILFGFGFNLVFLAGLMMLLGMGLWLQSVSCPANNREWRKLGRRVQRVRSHFA